jgi:hypothetical protein
MRIATALVLLLGTAATVRAQSPSIFVEGALFHDGDTQRTAGAPGGGATVGVRLSPHFSIRFDSEFPGWSERSYSDFYASSCSPQFCVVSSTSAGRTITYAVMFGGHFQPHRSIDVAVLGGLSTADHRSRYYEAYDSRTAAGALIRYTDDSHYESRSALLSFGAETSFSVSRHLAFVPEIRTHVYPEFGAFVRPRIAARWTF